MKENYLSMKIIRLVVFNEDYWSKGLIYSQNIQPLIELAKKYSFKIEIISFTPALIYFKNRTKINLFSKEMKTHNIIVRNFLTCYYPTRLLITRWYLVPFLFLNTFIYILLLRLGDVNKNVIYNLRSYESALAFYLSYSNYNKIVFDTRTDWIEESINANYFSSQSYSAKFWLWAEKKMISHFKHTLFISDQFKQNVLSRHNIEENSEIFKIIYNPIDYSHFKKERINHSEKVFLYTGSFGQWNKLDIYLDFFSQYCSLNDNAKFVVCTSTSKNKVEKVLSLPQYSSIKEKVAVYYNVSHDELPYIYNKCDYGLQLMTKQDSRVGVKVVEYIASGLIPIVSSNVQGAAYLVEKYKLGIVVSDKDSIKSIFDKIELCFPIDTKSSNYKAFQELTDLNNVSDKLYDIYK